MPAIVVNTSARTQMVDITAKINEVLGREGAPSGLCHVFVPHTTAAVTVNESADPAVVVDILDRLEQLAPRSGSYGHLEGNADAHIKAALVGPQVLVPMESGALRLGRWQGVFFCEFDGPRQRDVWIQVL